MKNFVYGIVGNGQSAALISSAGSVDWLCLPHFDSYSVFAHLLDKKNGGLFGILPSAGTKIEQSYLPLTNILHTRFHNTRGEFEIFDFMPRYFDSRGAIHAPPDFIRYVRRIRGVPSFRIQYKPRLCYGQYHTLSEVQSGYLKSFSVKGIYESIYLYSNLDLNKIHTGTKIELTQDAFFCLSYNQKILTPNLERSYLEFQKTKVYWLDWSARTKKFPHFNDEIIRSALTLKLLAYQKTGAILAAVTTSLPETIGENRNWDYRYCWIRDAGMIMSTLTRINQSTVAKRYLNFILDVISFKDENIQIMYGIHGEKKLTEKTLDFLEGYECSKPVRIGNDAYRQKQHDIYGVLLDAIFQVLHEERTLDQSERLWTMVRTLVRNVEKNWTLPDRGIWEYRHKKEHFVFSKTLCWVAVDRAIKIAWFLGQKEYVKLWTPLSDQIKIDILHKGWNEKLGAFTQFYGSDQMDASNLLMEPYGFLKADDPKYISTVQKTRTELLKRGLMFRYKNADDFGSPKTAFTICTFWMIKALFQIGERAEALALFQQMLKYGNHLGLFSEGLDFKSKRLLGNFPQGYSHLALIDTAIALSGGQLSNDLRLENLLQH